MTSYKAYQKLIIYDAHCIICNASAHIIAKQDKTNTIYFTHAKTSTGQQYADMLPDNLTPDMTVAFVSNSRVYVMSDAVIEVARHLRFPFSLLKGLRLLPKTWRDGLYRLIARNRFRIFKRRQSCILPSPDLRVKMIE
ncbi:MAG: thiol-disulfide oxidoreductase DCC family protein [Bacteroidota bacterium]